MNSESVKQIIIAYNAIESACNAMLKPARIELNDSESVAKMPNVQYDTLEYIKTDCKAIQKVLYRMADYIGTMEESIYDDGEIEEAGNMINDILFDVLPVSTKTFNPHSISDVAKICGV